LLFQTSILLEIIIKAIAIFDSRCWFVTILFYHAVWPGLQRMAVSNGLPFISSRQYIPVIVLFIDLKKTD
jgi:hypothetical protein